MGFVREERQYKTTFNNIKQRCILTAVLPQAKHPAFLDLVVQERKEDGLQEHSGLDGMFRMLRLLSGRKIYLKETVQDSNWKRPHTVHVPHQNTNLRCTE